MASMGRKNPIKLYVNVNKFDCLVTVTTEIGKVQKSID